MSISTKRVPHIGILFWTSDTIDRTYCPDLFLPIKDAATKGLLTFQYLAPSGPAQHREPFPPLAQVKAGGFDGLVSISIWKETYVGDLYNLGMPVVTLDYRSNGWPIDSVTFGSRPAFRQIAQILKDTGHHDVLFMSIFRPEKVNRRQGDSYLEDDTSLERRMALQEALADTNIEMWPLLPVRTFAGMRREAVAKSLRDLITNIGKAPSAISGHDTGIVAYGRQALEDLKLRVPQDVSLISVSAANEVTSPNPKVTMDTLQFNWRQMGAEGLRMLWERMAGKVPANLPPRHIELAGTYLPMGTLTDRRNVPPA